MPSRAGERIAAAGFEGAVAGAAPHVARQAGAGGGFESAAADAARIVSSRSTVRNAVTQSSFGDTSVAARGAAVKRSSEAADTTGVEILSKPRPAYTAEARKAGIEGEVLIEMMFSATGEAHVIRIVRGLGHGLDETSIEAARAIRFRPATRGGRPVDAAAVVHISFQLAY